LDDLLFGIVDVFQLGEKEFFQVRFPGKGIARAFAFVMRAVMGG
jgi:hypothetical protein